MKLMSWNVNGIRACLTHGFIDSIEKYKPDVICLQETKAHPEQVDIGLKDYEHHFWNSAERKGYSSVAVFSKIKPISVKYGFGVLDEEGRAITLEFEDFYLITLYVLNSKPELERVDLRYNEWDKKFLNYIKSLNKPVIFCGDLNVAHQEIDLSNSAANKTTANNPGHAGFTDKEREGFENYLKSGYVDSFRLLHPNEIKYSWWSYRFKAREKNIGWRIDYFMVDDKLQDKIKKAEILNDITGSDHCPVWLELE